MKRYLHTPEEVIQALKEGKTVKDEYEHAFELKNGFIKSKDKRLSKLTQHIYF